MAASKNENLQPSNLNDDKKEISQLLQQLQQAPKHGKETRILSNEQSKILAIQIKKLLKQHLN